MPIATAATFSSIPTLLFLLYVTCSGTSAVSGTASESERLLQTGTIPPRGSTCPSISSDQLSSRPSIARMFADVRVSVQLAVAGTPLCMALCCRTSVGSSCSRRSRSSPMRGRKRSWIASTIFQRAPRPLELFSAMALATSRPMLCTRGSLKSCNVSTIVCIWLSLSLNLSILVAALGQRFWTLLCRSAKLLLTRSETIALSDASNTWWPTLIKLFVTTVLSSLPVMRSRAACLKSTGACVVTADVGLTSVRSALTCVELFTKRSSATEHTVSETTATLQGSTVSSRRHRCGSGNSRHRGDDDLDTPSPDVGVFGFDDEQT
mmetsp:Transcript_27471/g.53695  ORF Transcript_27471/g.53695 Transcript_27471/m.53695 type:complete len:321 (+) Transcript_27471:368-1330(+)